MVYVGSGDDGGFGTVHIPGSGVPEMAARCGTGGRAGVGVAHVATAAAAAAALAGPSSLSALDAPHSFSILRCSFVLLGSIARASR